MVIKKKDNVLIYKWGKPPDILLLIIVCIFLWDTAKGSSAWSICALLFALPIAYTLLASLINRTTLTWENEALAIKHYPIPWPGNRTILREEMKSLCRKTRITRRTRHKTYDLAIVLKNGMQIALLKGLEEDEIAPYTIYIGKLLGIGVVFDDRLDIVV